MAYPYSLHDEFIRPAYAKSEPTRVLLMLFGFEVILGLIGWVTFVVLPQEPLYPDATPFGTVLGFATFGMGLILFHLLALQVHARGIATMLGPWEQLKDDGLRSFIAVGLLLMALEILMPTYAASEIEETRNVLAWAVMLPIGLIAIMVQCATEEVVYRGYLQQQVAVLSRGAWAYILIPSLAFGMGHYWNGWGPSDGILYAIWATFLGLACADLTARSGCLGAAIGLHTANNVFATVLFAENDGPSSGLALFLIEQVDWASFDYSLDTLWSGWTLIDIAFSAMMVFLMWLTARIAIRR